MTFADFMYGVLMAEATLILFAVVLTTVGLIVDWIGRKLNPIYPYCNIDPRCHPAFVLDKDGIGWIGNVRVPT